MAPFKDQNITLVMDISAQRDDAGCILFFEFNDLQHGVEGVASIDWMQKPAARLDHP